MQNDDYGRDEYQTIQVRVPIRYIEKKVYVTDAATAVLVIEEIRQYYKDGLFNTGHSFDGARFELMLGRLIKKYQGGEIK